MPADLEPPRRDGRRDIVPPSQGAAETALSEHFNSVAGQWSARYRDRASFVARLQCVASIVDTAVLPGSQVLDFGAGAGIFSLVASATARLVVALDSSWAMLASGAENLDEAVDVVASAGWSPHPEIVHRVHGSIDCIRCPVFSDGFDAVLAIAVLEYLPDPLGVIRRLGALLRPGGTLIFTYPDERSLLRRVERPIDAAAACIGHITGISRLREREYDLLRPSSPVLLAEMTTAPEFTLIEQGYLPLGLQGWRRHVRPNALVTLRKRDR